MHASTIFNLQILLSLAGSDYLYHQDLPPASQNTQTLHLDSDRIYGIREPEGFGSQNLTCTPGTTIEISSVRFGFKELGHIPLCGEASNVPDKCVATLDRGHVRCQANSCAFPSLADWGPESFSTAESCGGGLQYWHICYDCIGAEYATEVINDMDDGGEAYEYYQGDEEGYYYYYSDMYHPQVTNRFDVDGYDDITCEHGDLIKILSVKFGYDEQSLKSDDTSDPCVFDFTNQFSAGLCTETECKSPTLQQLGLANSVACGQSPGLGLWQIYYTCEKLGDIEIKEPQKNPDTNNQVETHVESIQAIDVYTPAPLKAANQIVEKNKVDTDIEDQNTVAIIPSSQETVAGIHSTNYDLESGETIDLDEHKATEKEEKVVNYLEDTIEKNNVVDSYLEKEDGDEEYIQTTTQNYLAKDAETFVETSKQEAITASEENSNYNVEDTEENDQSMLVSNPTLTSSTENHNPTENYVFSTPKYTGALPTTAPEPEQTTYTTITNRKVQESATQDGYSSWLPTLPTLPTLKLLTEKENTGGWGWGWSWGTSSNDKEEGPSQVANERTKDMHETKLLRPEDILIIQNKNTKDETGNLILTPTTTENLQETYEFPTNTVSKSEEGRVQLVHKLNVLTTDEDASIEYVPVVKTSILDAEEENNDYRSEHLKNEDVPDMNLNSDVDETTENIVSGTSKEALGEMNAPEQVKIDHPKPSLDTIPTVNSEAFKIGIKAEDVDVQINTETPRTIDKTMKSSMNENGPKLTNTDQDVIEKTIINTQKIIKNMDEMERTREYQEFTETLDDTETENPLNPFNEVTTRNSNMNDLSKQDETLSSTKNAKLFKPLNHLETSTEIDMKMEHESTNGNGTEPQDRMNNGNVKLDNTGEISENFNYNPYLMLAKFTEPNLSQTTLELGLERHPKPGNNSENHLTVNKSQEDVPMQQTKSDQTTPESLSTVDMSHSDAIITHKYQEIKKNKIVLTNSDKKEIENFTSKEHLVKTKVNFEHQGEIKSEKTELKASSSEIKCNDVKCSQLPMHFVESTSSANNSETNPPVNNSVQNYGAKYKSSVDQPSLNNSSATDVSTVASLETDDGNRKTENVMESKDRLSTIDPANPIIDDDEKDIKTENFNHHMLDDSTMDDINISQSQSKSLKSDTINKIEHEQNIVEVIGNLKDVDKLSDNKEQVDKRLIEVSRFASANSKELGNEPILNEDSSLDVSRNKSLEVVGNGLTTKKPGSLKENENKSTKNEENTTNEDTKQIIKDVSQQKSKVDKKHRREKLLIEKGHFKITSTIATSATTQTATTPVATTPAATTPAATATTTKAATVAATTTKAPTTTTATTTATKTTVAATTKVTTVAATTAETTTTITEAETTGGTSKPKMYTYTIDEVTTRNFEEKVQEDEKLHQDENTEYIVVEPVTIEEEMEEEIFQGIDQLKSELKMLLVFEDNILNASNEIVKEATKAKVTTFFESVSSSLNVLRLQKKIHKNDKSTDSKKSEIKKKEEINAATSILNITADISKSLSSTLELGTQVDIKLPNISMTVMKKRMGKMGMSNSSVWEADSLKVNLPDQSTIAGADSSITVSFTSYENLGAMMSMDGDFSSSVLSVNVLGVEKVGNSIPLTKPMEFILSHKPMTDFSERKCVYWDFEESGWSQKGCYAVAEKSTEITTMCQCYHLTNFAVLVDVYGLAQSEQHKNNLDVITWIGCGISIMSLTLCIYVFSTFRSAKNDRSAINTNLCFCILLAELFFLCGIGQTAYPSFCSVVAAVLHYLFLASFFWMLIAGFQIYVLLVEVFEPDGSRFVQYYLLGYIAPLLIVLCSLLMDTLLNYESVYGFRDFCWINSNTHLVLTFLMPVFLIVGTNVYFLSVAVWKIHVHSRDSLIVHKSKTASLKMYVKGLFGLLFLLGVTWGFGIISVTHPSLTFTYIFTILNSLHGFFIFMFNCVMNKKIRNEGRNKIEDLLSCLVKHRRKHTLLARKESTLSNTSATSQTNSTMVKEYFLPELPYTIETKTPVKKSKQNALSITYYY